MRKIGIIIATYAHEKLIRQFLEQVSDLDKIVVMFQQYPLLPYVKEHQTPTEKDNTESIVKELAIKYPNLEYHDGTYNGEWVSLMTNEGLPYVQDMDIVLRLDIDCFFTKEDWKRFIDFIRTTENDCYRLDHTKYSINYYGIDDFEHGVKDGLENDIMAYSPRKQLDVVINYDASRPTQIELEGLVMHHLKGWKKTYTKEWLEASTLPSRYNGEWLKAPQEIINLVSNK